MTDSTAAALSALRAAQAWARAGCRPMCFPGQSSPELSHSTKRSGKQRAVQTSANHRQLSTPPYAGQRRLATTQAGLSGADNPFPLPTTNTATPYDVFHLARNSSKAEIKSRYYDLVKIYHPDRISARVKMLRDGATAESDEDMSPPEISSADSKAYGETMQQANHNFKRIRDAYTLLSDDGRRSTYDKSGWGWDPTGDNDMGMQGSGAPPAWTGGYPRTPDEWASYEAWSASLRRGGPGSANRQGWEYRGTGPTRGGFASGVGHDRFGWQQYAGNRHNLGADWFYGYGHAQRHTNPDRAPLYMANHRFFLGVSLLTALLGLGQYARIKEEAGFVSNAVEQRHQSAARSLDAARKFARSDSAKLRREEWRRKRGVEQRDEPLLALPPPAETPTVGRGGPSGKEAHDERMRRGNAR